MKKIIFLSLIAFCVLAKVKDEYAHQEKYDREQVYNEKIQHHYQPGQHGERVQGKTVYQRVQEENSHERYASGQKYQGKSVETRVSYTEEVTNSLFGVFVGIFFFIFSFPILWFNERKALADFEFIALGEKECSTIDSNESSSELDGKLVHVNGTIITKEELVDQEFGVRVRDAVKLRTSIEVFQMVETEERKESKDQVGGGKTVQITYFYQAQWKSNIIDSRKFNDSNFVSSNNMIKFITKGNTIASNHVNLGQYTLTPAQINKLSSYKALEISTFTISEDIKNSLSGTRMNFHQNVVKNQIYFSQNPSKPTVGDIRISFEYVPCNHVTVVAQKQEKSFCPYIIDPKDRMSDSERAKNETDRSSVLHQLTSTINSLCWTVCCCFKLMDKVFTPMREIDWIYEQRLSRKQVFDNEQANNSIITWAIRLLGFILMCLGLVMIFDPLSTILSFVKIIGTIASVTINVACCIAAFIMSASVILLSWVAHRPTLVLTIFGLMLVILFLYK